MKRLLLVAALLCLASKAQAQATLNVPAQGTCGPFGTNLGFCFKLTNNYPSGTNAPLELTGAGGRLLYAHSVLGNAVFITEPGPSVDTVSVRAVNQGAGKGAIIAAISNLAIEALSASNDGIASTTNSSTRSGLVGRNTSGAGSAGIWTDSQVWGAGWNIVSARSTKDKFGPNPYGLAEVLKLKPASYVLKADPAGVRRVGLVAEDVEAVMPLAVHQGPDYPDAPDGTPGAKGKKGVDMYALNVALVAAVQALEARLAAVEAAVKP